MNIKKSIKIALVERDQNQEWLAVQVGVSRGAISLILSRNSITTRLLGKIALALQYKVSELIALGEVK